MAPFFNHSSLQMVILHGYIILMGNLLFKFNSWLLVFSNCVFFSW